ncbi:MAG: FG-GAP repeat protein [Ignavibacteria bacterium]|nr:FG-GAP repeat protein [Ignavibacteria bacterium]
MNGDGYPGIIIGAPINSSKGKVYVYYGGMNMNNVSDMTLSGETTNSQYGNSVAFAGDMNGDGFPDLIIGAWGHNSNTGKVYLYMESMTGSLFSDLKLNGEAVNTAFGISVSSAGDVNNDGFNDVVVGASNYQINFGKAYIYFGGVNMDNTADITLSEGSGTIGFGSSVSSAGDLNGDGYADVIVGAAGYNSSQGRAYIYFGGSFMNNVSDVTLTGEATGNLFGNSVSDAGDVNGDGYSDVIVGASSYPSTGRAYIFYGGSAMNNIRDLTLAGETNSKFGVSVSNAGDVNGDGFSDVIIGGENYSNVTGRAYIFYGASSMDSLSDVNLTGPSSSSYFGHDVSDAGDVNGDGYSDVIVGVCNLESLCLLWWITYEWNSRCNN